MKNDEKRLTNWRLKESNVPKKGAAKIKRAKGTLLVRNGAKSYNAGWRKGLRELPIRRRVGGEVDVKIRML